MKTAVNQQKPAKVLVRGGCLEGPLNHNELALSASRAASSRHTADVHLGSGWSVISCSGILSFLSFAISNWYCIISKVLLKSQIMTCAPTLLASSMIFATLWSIISAVISTARSFWFMNRSITLPTCHNR